MNNVNPYFKHQQVEKRIKPKWKVILIMLSKGWWKIGKYHIYNMFGYGYWSKNKFGQCGKILSGTVLDNMFISDVWNFQLFFTEEVK